jgi:hypothetical protein
MVLLPEGSTVVVELGDNPLYHPLRREFTVTEGSVPGTRGSLGSECRDPRGFMAEFGGKRQVGRWSRGFCCTWISPYPHARAGFL